MGREYIEYIQNGDLESNVELWEKDLVTTDSNQYT